MEGAGVSVNHKDKFRLLSSPRENSKILLLLQSSTEDPPPPDEFATAMPSPEPPQADSDSWSQPKRALHLRPLNLVKDTALLHTEPSQPELAVVMFRLIRKAFNPKASETVLWGIRCISVTFEG